jgi:thioredoxin-like negative regulator of GroEL
MNQGFAQGLDWLTDYNQAVTKAKQTGKPIFIDCFADWCVWCHRLEKEVYTDSSFLKFSQDFIPLRINVEDQAEGSRIAEQFQVDSLPSILIIESDGTLIDRVNGFHVADELISEIQSMWKLNQKEKLVNDWQTEQKLGEEYLFRDMNREAEPRFAKILESTGVPDNQKESAYFSLALSQYYQGKEKQALVTLNRYLETYVDGDSTENVLLLLSQIYIETDQKDKARTILEQFITKFPDSENVGRAKEVLAHLNS